MISFICWKWRSPFKDGRVFGSEHVNVLRASVAKHYPSPHRFVCITDDTSGLDARVEAFPMPETGLEGLRTPRSPATRADARGRVVRRIPFPSCYRRLWMFSKEAEQLGEWVFCLDLDCLIVGEIAPLVDDFPADFVGWMRETGPRRPKPSVAGAVFKLRTGSRTDVWNDFNPDKSPRRAAEAGYTGTDQAWMSYKLLPTSERMWTDADGLGKPGERPRPGDRILFTAGYAPPWSDEYARKRPWVGELWKEQRDRAHTRQEATGQAESAVRA